MLPLSTEATLEALNVFMDRRLPFHTYNDHNRFRQFGFKQQNRPFQHSRHGKGQGKISNGKDTLRQ